MSRVSFFGLTLFLLNGAKKKNVKKMEQFSGTHILQTTGPISFKLGESRTHIYGGHKICEFDRNRPSDYRDMRD